VKLLQVVSLESMQVVSVSLGRLTQLVLSVDVEVDILNESLLVSVMVILMLLTHLFLQQLKLVTIERGI
jgi:hypothetical protein